MEQIDLSGKKKMRNILFCVIIILALLIIRVLYIQVVTGEELSYLAYQQQTLNRNINPKRGTIYDSQNNVLAISSTVETVTINPVNIKESEKEKVAQKLSELFELDYDKVYKKTINRSSIETIITKISKEKADELRIWMKENNITTGINIDEDTKRYYPNNNLASQIIGFCGSDNQGLDGIEAKYDEILKGSIGAIKKQTDARGTEIGTEGEEYIAAIDGDSLILSIDMNIQSIAEKYLEQAVIDNVCTDGGNVVIMNPQNGDVLAMATYPTYNLNTPFEPYTDELKEIWEDLETSEQTLKLQEVWRNTAIADTYEPGSTFKLITAAAALEEGITSVSEENQFNCTGSIEIAGVRIKCWRYYNPHGSQTLTMGLMNSCNPVFIGLGQQIGVSKYYEYLQKFNLLGITGIDLPGEAKSIFLDEKKAGVIELATISFGQRFEITPIQLVTAVSVIANEGKSITPRVVTASVNSQTGKITEVPVEGGEQIISKQTATDILGMMEEVVSEGTAKNAKVVGYSVGGKTGTSEDGVNTNKYIASFIGVASIENPELVILVTLYNPTGEAGHQGGGVAAPVGGQILNEILPYLEIQKTRLEDVEEKKEVQMPNLIGETMQNARTILKELNIDMEIINEDLEFEEYEVDEENTYVRLQIPEAGIKIDEKSTVYLDY